MGIDLIVIFVFLFGLLLGMFLEHQFAKAAKTIDDARTACAHTGPIDIRRKEFGNDEETEYICTNCGGLIG
jgi:hypothetical protein